jgi:hypothetical protein
MTSDIEQDTPVGVVQEPDSRSEEQLELAERLVTEPTRRAGADRTRRRPHGPDQAGARGRPRSRARLRYSVDARGVSPPRATVAVHVSKNPCPRVERAPSRVAV